MNEKQPRRSVRFSAAQWQSIRRALSGAQRNDQWSLDDPSVKRGLEEWASHLWAERTSELKWPPTRKEKIRYAAVAKKAQALADEVRNLPLLAGATLEQELMEVRSSWRLVPRRKHHTVDLQLKGLSRFARRLAEEPSQPHNVDGPRNEIWVAVGVLYEQVTGRHVAVNNRAISSTPDGPFIRFIRAFMAAIPDEPVPTGHQLRNWFRTYWKPRVDG